MLFMPFYFAPCSLVGFVRCTGGHALTSLFVLFRPKAAENLPEEIAAELTTEFSLAWTGPAGHMLLVDPSDGPEIHKSYYKHDDLTPHGVKLMSNRTYDCFFVRHPDVEWVKEAWAELNGKLPLSKTKDWFPTPVKPEIDEYQPPKLDKDTPAPPAYNVLTLKVGEDPGKYYPRGPERYGKWLLYKDMPNAECPLARKAVNGLQLDLGRLRYMVGAEHPYMPEKLHDNKDNINEFNEGKFDGRTINSVYLFQRDVQSGAGKKVDPKATIALAGPDETETSSLAYLSDEDYAGGPRAITVDGVVDQQTCDALEQRLRDGVVNPLNIMVCTLARDGAPKLNWNVWMRPEAAASLYCWRELARALGFPLTVAANHTFRSAAVNVGSAGFGRSWKSIHKVGLAIDVGLDRTYFQAADDWPVFYQRDLSVDKKNKKKDVEGYRIYWRVFAITNYMIPEPDSIALCRANLVEVTKNDHKLGKVAREAALRLIDEIDKGKFAAKYFRERVKQWQYDPWDGDGGKEGPEVSAPDARKAQLAAFDEFFAANEGKKGKLIDKKRHYYSHFSKAASRFLDLTALAQESNLERIGSFTNHFDPTTTGEWGLGLATYSTGKFQALAKAMKALKADHPNFAIEIAGEQVKLADVDVDFMEAFGAARVDCAVARGKDAEKMIAAYCEKLRKFPARRFVRTPDDEAKTGEEWAAAIEAKLEEVKTAAPVNKKDSSKGSTKKKDSAGWTFRLSPDYGVVFPLKTGVYMPSPGAPIGLEWWHFQVSSLIDNRAFGPLICEMGWTKETLLDEPQPHLHYRIGMGYPQNAWTDQAG
ncbi:MAG: hypothetical protein HYX27_16780 [Acidobacteria bacterium]|nr:hypothetical protein [Acidobacteriota bacterium]